MTCLAPIGVGQGESLGPTGARAWWLGRVVAYHPRMRIRRLLLPVAILTACSSSDDTFEPSDAGLSADAVVAPTEDAGLPHEDAGFENNDVGFAGDDAGFADDAEVDAGLDSDSGTTEDAGGGGPVICAPGRVDGLAWGWVPTGGVTFEPGGAGETTLALVEPTMTLERAYVARLTSQNGVAWAAQATSNAATSIDIIATLARHDPATGEVYAIYRTQSLGTEVRFYSAGNSEAAAFTAGGAPGEDLVGQPGQTNLFVVRYTASGQVEWVKRFGPNDPQTGNRNAVVVGLEIRATSLRVVVDVDRNPITSQDPGDVVIDPGAPGQVVRTNPLGHAMIFELDRATGAIATGGGVIAPYFIETDEDLGIRAFVPGSGEGTTSYGIGGAMSGGSGGSVRFGPVTLNPDHSAAVVGLVDSTDGISWARAIVRPSINQNFSPRPWSLLATSSDTLVAAVYANAGGSTAVEYSISTPNTPTTFTVDGNDNVLVHFDAEGAVAWTYRIALRTERQLFGMVEHNGALFAVGESGQGIVFDLGTATEIRLAPSGSFISKHSLVTGALEWVQQIGATASPRASVLVPKVSNSGLRVPVRMTETTVNRNATPTVARVSSGNLSFAVLDYDPQGAFQMCTEIVAGAEGVAVD